MSKYPRRVSLRSDERRVVISALRSYVAGKVSELDRMRARLLIERLVDGTAGNPARKYQLGCNVPGCMAAVSVIVDGEVLCAPHSCEEESND